MIRAGGTVPGLGAALVVAGLLVLGGAPSAGAAVITVLDEDFDDVSWSAASIQSRRRGSGSVTGNRSVHSILATSPWELPWGTIASSSTDVGVRSSTDKINTAKGKKGFDGYFATGNLAVLGDQKDRIGGAGASGVFWLDLPFTLADDVDTIELSYDFAFDGSGAKSSKTNRKGSQTAIPYDVFMVSILGEAGGPVLVQQLTSAAFGSGHFHLDGLPLAGGDYILRFQLTEHASKKTNSALGLDNITVSAYSGEPYPEGPPSEGEPPWEVDPGSVLSGPSVNSVDVAQIPAPGGLILLGAGLAVLAARRARIR